MHHVFDLRRFQACGRNFHGYGSGSKWFSLKPIQLQLAGNFCKYSLLCGRQLDQQRHQQALTFDLLYRPLSQDFLEEKTFMSHMLIDNPEAVFIDRENKRIPDLSKSLERA